MRCQCVGANDPRLHGCVTGADADQASTAVLASRKVQRGLIATDRSSLSRRCDGEAMKNAAPSEQKRETFNGTGYQAVRQPSHPNRRIYPPPCNAATDHEELGYLP